MKSNRACREMLIRSHQHYMLLQRIETTMLWGTKITSLTMETNTKIDRGMKRKGICFAPIVISKDTLKKCVIS